MAVISTALQPVAADFDNYLTAPEPRRVTVLPRYGLLVALAMLGLSVRLLRWLDQLPGATRLRWVAVVPGLIVATLGLSDALGNDCTVRVGEVRLGQWIRQEVGPSPSLRGVEGLTVVVMRAWRWASETNGQTLLERVEAHGYQKIEHQCLPEECCEVLILVREGKASRMARWPASEAATRRGDQSHPL